jgi:UDP-glucose 4-epimerase
LRFPQADEQQRLLANLILGTGDPAVLIASSEKIQTQLGWQPKQQDLCGIIESAWKWMRRQA